MGLAGFLKKLFSGEPEPSEIVNADEIGVWLKQKLDAQAALLEGQISGIGIIIREESAKARELVSALNRAELRNPNIPEKAKHFMQGNREEYSKRVLQLIDRIQIPSEFSKANEIIALDASAINEFARATARPYAILREFFDDEASKVAECIKKIDSAVLEMAEFVKCSKIGKISEAIENESLMRSKAARKNEVLEEVDKKKSHAASCAKDREALASLIASKEKSDEHKEHVRLKNALSEIRANAAEKEREVVHLFSSLERPLRKYERVAFSDSEVIKDYLESPVNALSHDFGLKILNVLDKLKKAVLDNSLELKDKQKAKALQDIRQADREFLNRFLSEYAQLKKKESEAESKAAGIKVMEEINSAKEKLAIADAMLDKAKKDIALLESEFSKLCAEEKELKKSLQDEISSAFSSKVLIS